MFKTLIFLFFFSINASANTTRIAIVIDDMGYRPTDHAALTLPGNISYAILPHTPFGKKLALQAQENKKDVILHIPMEASNGKKLGPGGLTLAMDRQAFNRQLAKALHEIPFAKGINNHMGSELTQHYEQMMWTMSFLKDHNLLFLDSMTSKKSQGIQAALDSGVPVERRHVFLDNQLDKAYIHQQFQQLLHMAEQNQYAIALAHPHPETISALKELLPTLKARNIELVAISSLYEKVKTPVIKPLLTATSLSTATSNQ